MDKLPENPTPSEVARWLASRPRRDKIVTCAWCGKTFTGKGRRLYCSRSCQEKARRARVKRRAESSTDADPTEGKE